MFTAPIDINDVNPQNILNEKSLFLNIFISNIGLSEFFSTLINIANKVNEIINDITINKLLHL